MSLHASCTQCGFLRRFADTLAGKYFRCPRCKEGVIAVPAQESEELSFRSSSQAWRPPLPPQSPRSGKTEVLDSPDETSLERPAERASDSGSRTSLLAGRPLREELQEEPAVRGKRGQVGLAQRLLVECGLCGFHVEILAEFFGKTVYCPECTGNTVFTESTLNPVKDELLDRLVLDSQEREALRGRGQSAEEARPRRLLEDKTLRSFLVGIGLGFFVLALGWLLTRG